MAQAKATAPAERTFPVRRIVVPVGGTDREFLAQEHAVLMASALDAPIAAVHVRADPEDAPADLFTYLREHAERWGVPLEEHVFVGNDVASILEEELEPLDLVVVGTRKMGSRFHVGSVAEHVVRHAPCPVQVVRLDA